MKKLYTVTFRIICMLVGIGCLILMASNRGPLHTTKFKIQEVPAILKKSTQNTTTNTLPTMVSVNLTAVNRAIPTTMNPGCIFARKLSKFKPVDTGRVYHHPSLVQYAKLSQGSTSTSSFTFMEYMAMMSAYKFLRPEKIMIHAYTDITGKYWNYIQKWNTSVEVNKVKRISTLGGKKVQFITHQADFIKLRGLLEFGGIISDFDVIVVNGTKIKSMQRISECVLSLEDDHDYSGLKELVNAGFNSCVKNSSFVRKWLDGYNKHYAPGDWLANASVHPTRELIGKATPCYNMYVVDNIATHPRFNQYKDWLTYNGVKWRTKIAAHYFNKVIKNFDESSSKRNDSMGELLRYVKNASVPLI